MTDDSPSTPPRTPRWRVPLPRPAKLSQGERLLATLDRRLGKTTGRLSPVDARYVETLRLWRESWKEGTTPGQVTVLTAMDLSLQLQVIAARIEDETDAAIIATERRRIEAIWRVVHDLDLARTESRDPKAILLRYVEQARESDLDIAKQVRFVVRYVSEADAAFASRLDLALLRTLLLAWEPKRGRPKKAEAKQPDQFVIAAKLLGGATGVHVSAPSLRRYWERS